MKKIYIYKNESNDKIINILLKIKKIFDYGFKIEIVTAKKFIKKFLAKSDNNLHIVSQSVTKVFLRQLSQVNHVKDKSTRILIAQNGYKDVDVIFNLIYDNVDILNKALGHFNYLVFKIDPYFNKDYQKKIEQLNGFGNLIFLGFEDKFLAKNNIYVDMNADIRLPKFLRNLILFKNVKLLSSSNMPIKAMIEPIRSCNLRCPSCPIGSDKAKNFAKLNIRDYKKIIDKIYATVDDLSLFNYGEPLLHKDIDKMINYAKKKCIKKVKIHTNGILLTKKTSRKIINSGLDCLSISIDGASKESYDQYRIGGNFDALVGNIINFLDLRKELKSTKPLVRVQFIVMRHNEHEIDAFYKMFKKIGVDEIRYKTFNAHMDGGSSKINIELLPLNKKYTRYSDKNAKNISGKFKKTICNWPWEHIVINSNGDIAPCCYDYNAEYKLGNIFDNNWWNNIKRKTFRHIISNGIKSIKICEYCAVGIPDLSYKKIKL